MKRFCCTLLASLLALAALPLCAQQAGPGQEAQDEEPRPPRYAFLWKVEKEGHEEAYLFGTMHSPDPRVNELHPRVKQALNEAGAFYAEIDLADRQDLQDKMVAAMRLEEGRTLKDVLPAGLYADLSGYLQRKGFSIAMVNQFKPAMVTVQLAQLEMMDDLMQGRRPLDERLFVTAQSKDMEVGGVETIEEQLQALVYTLTEEEAVEQLRDTLDRLIENEEKGVSDMERMEEAWLSGSAEELLAIAHEQIDLDDPVDRKFWKALVWTRNEHMAERTAKILDDRPDTRFVFAFGALHMVGSGNVPDLLRQRGFKVTRLCAPPPPPAPEGGESGEDEGAEAAGAAAGGGRD